MRLKPDFERTATGWGWLDRVTAPWWRLRSRQTIRRLDRMFGITGDEAERRRQRRALWERLDLGNVERWGGGDG